MILAAVNTSKSSIEKLLKENKIKFNFYEKGKDFDNSIVFPSVKVFVKYKNKHTDKHKIKKIPLILDSFSNFEPLSLYENIVYLDCRARLNGIIHFQEIDTDKLHFLNSEYKSLKSSFLKELVDSLLSGFPKVIHTPFLVAFTHGIKDKFQEFNSLIKDNRLVTINNKKTFIQLNNYLVKLFKSPNNSEFKSSMQYLNYCNHFYMEKDLNKYLDNEGNIMV